MTPRLLCFLALCLCSGCAGYRWHAASPAPGSQLSNASAYDSYVVRRTDDLAAGGKYTRADAEAIARSEADRRFGARTTADGTQSASWTWSKNQSRELSLSELDQTVAGMKQK